MQYINRFTLPCKIIFEYSAEDFQCHVHCYQCFVVPVELTAMGFVFWFIGVEIAENKKYVSF
jgi:hypothetical protein